MNHFNKLTPAEVERLALLMEECAEVQQIIGKILRHGYESHHPKDRKKIPTTNRQMLERELGDLHAAIEICKARADINMGHITHFRDKKFKSVRQYLHHECGDDVAKACAENYYDSTTGRPE